MVNYQFTPDTIRRADELIKRVKETKTDLRIIDFVASQYLSGDGNKTLRRAVIYRAQHIIEPLKHCTVLRAADALKAAISQPALF